MNNVNAPNKYEQSNESLFRGNVDKALSALELKVSAIDQTAANIIPSGNVEFIIDPITSAVTARVSPLANTNSFGVIVSNTAFDVARASQTLHDFASETTPFDLSLGVLAPGDVRYVTLWFYRAAGGLGVASPAAYGKRFDFTAEVGPLSITTDKLGSGAATIAKGGVGFTTYVTGDLIYASASNTLAKRAIGTSGQFLRESGGAPDWHTLVTADVTDLTTAATGITKVGTIVTGVWNGTSISTSFTDAKIKTVTGTANRLTIGGTATDPTFDVSTSYAGQATITIVGTVVTGVWNATPVITTYGGTGLGSYSAGDLLYYASGTTLAKLGIGTTDRVLTSSGSAPQWSASLTGINTTGSAATLTTTRTIWGQNFNGSANVTGAMTGVSTISMSGALTYGGVTLSNAVTGTGSMVLSASPTFTGTITAATVNWSGLATFNGGATVASGQTLTVTGATITGLTAASVATGTFPGVYTVTGALTLSAALTYGGVTLSNAVTGTGNMVLSAGPTLTGTVVLTGTTITGAPTWSSSQAITLSTAAQPNVTSVGTLTSLAISGNTGPLLAVTSGGSGDGKIARFYYGSGANMPLTIGINRSNGDAWFGWNAVQGAADAQAYDIASYAARFRFAGDGTLLLQSAPSGAAAGAITWTTALTLTQSTNAFTFAQGFSVTTGTTAVQALTATTYTGTGTITKTNTAATNSTFLASATSTTGANVFTIANNNGTYTIGTENSAGSFFGVENYELVLDAAAGAGISHFIAGTGRIMRVTSTGVAVTGTLSSTAGISATTGTFTGDVTLTKSTPILALSNSGATTTTAAYARFTTGGGIYYIGVEDSAGGTFGATGYSAVWYVPGGLALQINNSTKAATFGAGISATTGTFSASGSTFASLVYSGQSGSWTGSIGSVWATTVSFVGGTTSSTGSGIGIGYDTGNSVGVIQPATPNVAYRGLYLCPQGGVVTTGGNLVVTGTLTAGTFAPTSIHTSSGSTSIAFDNSFHTLTSFTTKGTYILFLDIGADGTYNNRGATIIATYGTNGAVTTTVLDANLFGITTQWSGNNLQIKANEAFSNTFTVAWTALKIA